MFPMFCVRAQHGKDTHRTRNEPALFRQRTTSPYLPLQCLLERAASRAARWETPQVKRRVVAVVAVLVVAAAASPALALAAAEALAAAAAALFGAEKEHPRVGAPRSFPRERRGIVRRQLAHHREVVGVARAQGRLALRQTHLKKDAVCVDATTTEFLKTIDYTSFK
jgi:hypothetical protein